MTFAEWVELVKTAYQGSEPTHDELIMAIKDGARAVLVRDVESDLVLAKSYRDTFAEAKADLAGTRIADDIATVVAEVKTLMPIDDDTEAVVAMLENAIKAACNGLNGVADRFDALLIEAALELQRHVPFYQSRHENAYLKNSSGVEAEAFVSTITPPAGMRLSQIWYGHHYDALAEAVTYAAGDFVESNRRIYICRTGGTLLAGQLGAGLTSINYADEEIGEGLVFQFYRPKILVPVRNYPWVDRARMRTGRMGVGPVYALSPQTDKLWFYPALDDDHQFVMEWVGIKEEWEDSDEVSFDAKAAAAAAHFIRSHLRREVVDDPRGSAAEFALWQRDIRGLVVDDQQRKTGTTTEVAAYDYYRRAGCVGVLACRVSSGGGGSGSALSTTSGFSSTVTTLDLLAAVPTTNLIVGSFISFWNEDVEAMVTYRLIESTDAENRPGTVWPLDHDATSNAKAWLAVS
jgi:hypothetical protein